MVPRPQTYLALRCVRTGDGDLDMLMGGKYYQNTGNTTVPAWAATSLGDLNQRAAPWGSTGCFWFTNLNPNPNPNPNPGRFWYTHFLDVNADGKLDLGEHQHVNIFMQRQ